MPSSSLFFSLICKCLHTFTYIFTLAHSYTHVPYISARQRCSLSDDCTWTIPVTRRTTYNYRIFSYYAAKQCNSLPFNICHLPTNKSLKNALKHVCFIKKLFIISIHIHFLALFFTFYIVYWLARLFVFLYRFPQRSILTVCSLIPLCNFYVCLFLLVCTVISPSALCLLSMSSSCLKC